MRWVAVALLMAGFAFGQDNPQVPPSQNPQLNPPPRPTAAQPLPNGGTYTQRDQRRMQQELRRTRVVRAPMQYRMPYSGFMRRTTPQRNSGRGVAPQGQQGQGIDVPFRVFRQGFDDIRRSDFGRRPN